MPLFRMYLRSASLHIGRAHVRDGMPAVLELIQQGRLDPGQVTTAHADWEEADEAFREHIARGGTKLVISRRGN
jgi:threonine dehydrogenase-like Zn-dependent dehydrogenase